MIYTPFSPRHKTPYGAVPSGTAVTFTLRPARSEGFSSGLLLARLEQDGDRLLRIPMPWVSTDYQEDVFTGVLDTSGYVGLVWYSFQLEGLDGRCQTLGPYQLTVYDGSQPVPDWFGDGLCYQIFPDRFCKGAMAPADPCAALGQRLFHQHWQEEPLDGSVGVDENGIAQYNRDFFGGNLSGITEKLDFLADLGVETLYLCPIFRSAENHRYSTADYETIDPLLGTEADFRTLCDAAHARGMRVLLDGVFSHTGSASRYFQDATRSQTSPFSPWYQWKHWPDDYHCWWGVPTLPTLDKDCPSCRQYLYGDENAIVRRWLRAGADGWRLDVADELPDSFIAGLRQAVEQENPNAMVLGEVWEDGSNKIAYGVRRKHLLGGHLDGLMNYPFRTAALDYLLGGDAAAFRSALEVLREHYPPFAFHNAMNFLGTHDTPRVLSLLGEGQTPADKAERAAYRLSPEEERLGKERWKLASALLYAFPGSPMLFYGDEAGLQGLEDPFCRGGYPWGREDEDLLAWFRLLGRLRKRPSLRRGDLTWLHAQGPLLAFRRQAEGETTAAAFNAGDAEAALTLPWEGREALDLLTGQRFAAWEGRIALCLPARGAVLLTEAER